MAQAIESQPSELTRLLADAGAVKAVAERIEARRIFVIGSGTSFHAANQGAHLLRLAGVDALAVSAADSVLWGPAPGPGDVLLVLSHRGAKRAGLDAVLVLTGASRGDDVANADYAPDLVLDSIADLAHLASSQGAERQHYEQQHKKVRAR